jgi:hypothetical protein
MEPDDPEPELPKEPIFEDRNYAIKLLYNDLGRKFQGYSFINDSHCDFTIQGGDDLRLDFDKCGFHYKSRAFFEIKDMEGLYEEYVCFFFIVSFPFVINMISFCSGKANTISRRNSTRLACFTWWWSS